MEQVTARFTICFIEPFWIGLYERDDDNGYQVCRLIFGAEPKGCEVYELLLQQWARLSFSPALAVETTAVKAKNPKRVQREVRRQMEQPAVGTKAQNAFKLQQEQNQLQRKIRQRQQNEAEQAQRFALRQQKRKEKHRGH